MLTVLPSNMAVSAAKAIMCPLTEFESAAAVHVAGDVEVHHFLAILVALPGIGVSHDEGVSAEPMVDPTELYAVSIGLDFDPEAQLAVASIYWFAYDQGRSTS